MDSPHPASSRTAKSPSAGGDAELAPKRRGEEQPTTGEAERTPARAAPKPRWTLVATLVRPHGRRGEILADLLTDFPERFRERTRLYLIPPERVGTAAREMGLESFWFLRDRVVLKFAGIDSINEAENLRGYEVGIPFAERAEPNDGAVFVGDLIGCQVIDLNRGGVKVGEIVDLDRQTSSVDLLVVRPAGEGKKGGEALIPFVSAYVVRVDVAGRSVEMRLPEGLMEINAPMSDEEKRESSEAE